MFGNYIGDGIRTMRRHPYSDGVQKGIALHRFIDEFTDGHALVVSLRTQLYPTQRKFSGVVVDVLFDHLLAVHWSQFANVELEAFASNAYKRLQQHPEPMPERSAGFFRYMVDRNILVGYRHLSVVQSVFEGMDHRTKYKSHMALAVDDFQRMAPEMNEAFLSFFPELQSAVIAWINHSTKKS